MRMCSCSSIYNCRNGHSVPKAARLHTGTSIAKKWKLDVQSGIFLSHCAEQPSPYGVLLVRTGLETRVLPKTKEGRRSGKLHSHSLAKFCPSLSRQTKILKLGKLTLHLNLVAKTTGQSSLVDTVRGTNFSASKCLVWLIFLDLQRKTKTDHHHYFIFK